MFPCSGVCSSLAVFAYSRCVCASVYPRAKCVRMWKRWLITRCSFENPEAFIPVCSFRREARGEMSTIRNKQPCHDNSWWREQYWGEKTERCNGIEIEEDGKVRERRWKPSACQPPHTRQPTRFCVYVFFFFSFFDLNNGGTSVFCTNAKQCTTLPLLGWPSFFVGFCWSFFSTFLHILSAFFCKPLNWVWVSTVLKGGF